LAPQSGSSRIAAPAREWEEDRSFRFDVPIAMPLIGAVENASAASGASVRQNAIRGRATASKLFSKLFQISAVLLQAFPKKALAVLWNFNGLQGFQTQ
jgi:hypothetical protein